MHTKKHLQEDAIFIYFRTGFGEAARLERLQVKKLHQIPRMSACSDTVYIRSYCYTG